MSDIYYDTYNEGEAPEEVNKGKAVLKTVLTAAFVTALAFVILFFLYRMWEIRDPRGVGRYLWTEHAKSVSESLGSERAVRAPYNDPSLYAYEHEDLTTVFLTKKAPEKSDWQKISVPKNDYYQNDAFIVYTAGTGSYTVENSDGSETTVKCSGYYENKDSPVDRALRVSSVFLVPAAGQVQLTFRYRSDALSKLSAVAGADGSPFSCALEDDAGKLYPSYSYKTAKRGTYRYITMIFEGVDLSSVRKLDLIAEYLTEKGEYKNIPLYVYDSAIPLPVKEVAVKDGDVAVLPSNTPSFRALPNRILLSSL